MVNTCMKINIHTCTCVYPGARESAINRAEGLRQSKILASEAVRVEQINKAKGQLSHNDVRVCLACQRHGGVIMGIKCK